MSSALGFDPLKAVAFSQFDGIRYPAETQFGAGMRALLSAYSEAYEVRDSAEFQNEGHKIFREALEQVRNLAAKMGKEP